MLALDPQEPRVGGRRHLPQGVTKTDVQINNYFVIFSVLIDMRFSVLRIP